MNTDNDAKEFGEITIDGYVPVEEHDRPKPPSLRLVTRKGVFHAPTQTAEGVYTPFALSPPNLDDDAEREG